MEKKFTALHRSIHWVMAFGMPVLFVTGFLRMTWMSKQSVASVVGAKVDTLSKKELFGLAKELRDPMWQWHVWIAYIVIAAVVVRFIYMLSKGAKFANPWKSGLPWKARMNSLTYIYFYIFVSINAVTGICLHWHFFDNLHHELETVHKWGIWWFPIFILLHFVGITIGEMTNKKGIVSKMIGGE